MTAHLITALINFDATGSDVLHFDGTLHALIRKKNIKLSVI